VSTVPSAAPRGSRVFRAPDGALPNVLALGWTLGAWAGGIWLLTRPAWWVAAIGTLLVAHAMIYAAYYLHEFAHQSIFRSAEANNRWGAAMGWITGSCYAPFAALRRKHMRHHLDRADVVTFDYKAFLRASPPWVSRVVLALEWAYVPAVEFLMHGYVIALPFLKAARHAERPRIVAIALGRIAAFAALAAVSPKALLLYFVAWMLMLHVLRFADAYQHTYDALAVLEDDAPIPDDKLRDRAYEQANTYSNLVSVAHPGWNLLLLNFSYHNAHHERPIAPWHALPALHADLYGDRCTQVLPMVDLLKGYHRHRLIRATADDYGHVGTGPGRADTFLGAYGVSFLTAV
jgi:fatty acid desaturase